MPYISFIFPNYLLLLLKAIAEKFKVEFCDIFHASSCFAGVHFRVVTFGFFVFVPVQQWIDGYVQQSADMRVVLQQVFKLTDEVHDWLAMEQGKFVAVLGWSRGMDNPG